MQRPQHLRVDSTLPPIGRGAANGVWQARSPPQAPRCEGAEADALACRSRSVSTYSRTAILAIYSWTFEHPADAWRPAIGVSWYQGGAMPRPPREYIDLNKIGHGVMFKGSLGYLIADFQTRLLVPFGDKADFTYYKPRPAGQVIPPLGHFQEEWIRACKGTLHTSCDFDYSGTLCEQMLLAHVAYRAGQKIEYDGASGRVTNVPEANALLRRTYRPGWTLNG